MNFRNQDTGLVSKNFHRSRNIGAMSLTRCVGRIFVRVGTWAAAIEQPGRWAAGEPQANNLGAAISGRERRCESCRARTDRSRDMGIGRRTNSQGGERSRGDFFNKHGRSAIISPAGPRPYNDILSGYRKSGGPRIRGPCPVDHTEHVHRRA
jgi:hypothetical protein